MAELRHSGLPPDQQPQQQQPAQQRRFVLPSNPSNTRLQHERHMRAVAGALAAQASHALLGDSSGLGASGLTLEQQRRQADMQPPPPDGSLTVAALQSQGVSSSSWAGRLAQAAWPPPEQQQEALWGLPSYSSPAAAAALEPAAGQRYPAGRREVFVLSKWLEVRAGGCWQEMASALLDSGGCGPLHWRRPCCLPSSDGVRPAMLPVHCWCCHRSKASRLHPSAHSVPPTMH